MDLFSKLTDTISSTTGHNNCIQLFTGCQPFILLPMYWY